MNKQFRDQLYNMLHRQEQSLQENAYDIHRTEKRLAEQKQQREEITEAIEFTKQEIEKLEKGSGLNDDNY
jgi:cell division protein FtsB